jgi:hypothetical protein
VALPPGLVWVGRAGIVAFGLGYAIFLTNRNVQIVAAGLGNRTATAAALGVALSFVGAIGLSSALLRSHSLRRSVFCGAIAIFAMSGTLTINYIASHWIAAYRQEQEVLREIRARFPTLPANSGLVLDGVCSYVGPAVVFESDGLSGALVWLYRDPSVQGFVVTPRLRVEEEGISTSLYGVRYFHTYGDDLFLYHFGRGEIHRFVSAEAARAYFGAFNSDLGNGCPSGREGEGVPLF